MKTEFMSAIFAALLRASAFVGQFCRGEMNSVKNRTHNFTTCTVVLLRKTGIHIELLDRY